jgi:murein DD-endopeptidase MepM/ murein hydrolase activator NlpD
LDLKGKITDTVYSTGSGLIVKSKRVGGYGKCVVLYHVDGIHSIYAHLSKILVKENDIVTDHQPIGMVGSTGHSTGNHLHYEVVKNGEKINPIPYIYNK